MGKIYFRADAGPEIGMGHVMRCLSIADASKRAGHSVTFVLASERAADIIRSRGYDTVILATDYKDTENELPAWNKNEASSIDCLFVDSYFVTDKYLKSLKEMIGSGKLIYIDDLAAFAYPSDILINYNAYGPDLDYRGLYEKSCTALPKLILGAEYAPLREMFRGVPRKKQPERAENILISTGGSDELHLTLKLIRHLSEKHEEQSRNYHFLLGAMNEDRAGIKKLAGNIRYITLHENVSDMRELIESMDMAVSAAGSTMYEICACGVPIVTCILADNQIPGAEAFERLGLAVNAGDLRKPGTTDPKAVISGDLREDAAVRIMQAVDDLDKSYKARVAMGQKMQDMIDGCGADRIIKEVEYVSSV